MFRVVKIRAVQTDHVTPRAFVRLRVDVYFAHLHAFGVRIDHFIEGQRLHPAADKADDRAVFARGFRANELHRTVPQITRVLRIEGNRVRAAQLVTQILVDQRAFDSQLFKALQQDVLDHAAELDFAQAQMPVLIACDASITPELARIDGGEQGLLTDRFSRDLRS